MCDFGGVDQGVTARNSGLLQGVATQRYAIEIVPFST